MKYGLIVHGGAWNIPDSAKKDHLYGVKEACEMGFDLLHQGKNSIDVVEMVIKNLEDNPTFDAGIGSHLNDVGEVEMDAIIATEGYKIGSVCGIKNVKNPISVARKVMENTEHVIIAGDGASRFAQRNGFDFFPTEKLLIGREKETYEKIKNSMNFSTKNPFNPKKEGFGTVGVCVKDTKGDLAIGVSTGGTPFKLSGRIGDTPIWGSGGYVNSNGGIAGTGFGEDLIRIMISNRTYTYISAGMNPMDAAKSAIHDLATEVDGLGGVVVMTKSNFGLAFNTKRMAFAIQTDNFDLLYGIEPEDLQNITFKI